jgi:WD40 repeat protein
MVAQDCRAARGVSEWGCKVVHMNNLVGKTISHYEIQELVRADLVMAVYRAGDTQNQEARLLWVVFPERETSSQFRADFIEQLKLLSLLEHPNLLNVLDYGEVDGLVYWTTPDVSLHPLSQVLSERRTEKEAAALAAQIAGAIEYIHAQNIVHGNLSPETVFLGEDGNVTLSGFGMVVLLNREIARGLPERMLGFGIGRPPYLAPEQIEGREISAQTDLYVLGAIYYALLNGQPPYDSLFPAETAIRQVSGPLDWPHRLRTRISDSSIRLVHRCMARHEGSRFKSAADARKALERLALGKWARIPVRKDLLAGAPKRPNWVLRLVLLAVILCLAGWIVTTHSANLAAVFPARPTPTGAPGSIIAGKDIVQSTPTPKGEPVQPGETAPVASIPTAEPGPGATQLPAVSTSAPAAVPGTGIAAPVLAGTQVPGSPQMITIANAGQLREAVRIGMGQYNQVAWSPDKSALAVASSAGVFIVNSQGVQTFLDPKDEASSVQFSKDGQFLAVGTQHGQIQIWDWNTAAQVKTYPGHKDRISRLLFSPNGRQLISASYDAFIHVWSFPGESESNTISVGGQIKDMALSTDGRLVVSGSSDGWVRVWDVSSGEKVTGFLLGDKAEAVAISPDGNYVAGGNLLGEVMRWGVITKQQYGESNFLRKRIWSLYYTSNGNKLTAVMDAGATTQINAYQTSVDMSERLEKVDNPFQALYNTFGNDFEFLTHGELSPDGNSLAIITWDGKLTAQGFSSPLLRPAFDEFRRIVFSPDSKSMLIGGEMKHIYLIHVQDSTITGVETGSIAPGNPFSNDSQKIALAHTAEGVATLYTTDGLAKDKDLIEYPINAALSFSKNDQLVIAGLSNRTKFWDVHTGLETDHREGQNLGCEVAESANNGEKISVYSLAGLMTEWDTLAQRICRMTVSWGFARLVTFTSDRKWLASFSASGKQIEFYDVEDGDQAGNLRWSGTAGQAIVAMAISPDGNILAGGAADGSLTLWNGQNGDILLTIAPAHFGAIRAVAFSADGQIIATSGTDGTVRFWEVRPVP